VKQLVGYITAGVVEETLTIDLLSAMYEAGVDTIELGIPFSDPVADGPVIQAAGQRALEQGFRYAHAVRIAQALPKERDMLWMGYFNPFYQRGMAHALDEANAAGVSGFIIPDLPYEETLAYRPMFEERGMALIDFVAPTDPAERISRIVSKSGKFIYLVAYAGITGSAQSEELGPTIEAIKTATDTPVFVGFGVNEQTAKERVKGADGVIVGSAFVKTLIDDTLTGSEKIAKIVGSAKNIKDQINA